MNSTGQLGSCYSDPSSKRCQLGQLSGVAKGYPEQLFMALLILFVLLHLCLRVCVSVSVCLCLWNCTEELLKECDPCACPPRVPFHLRTFLE